MMIKTVNMTLDALVAFGVWLAVILLGILVAYSYRKQLFGAAFYTPVRIATVVLLVILGWAIARDVGRAAAPTFCQPERR